MFPLSKESSTEERQSVIPKETRLIRPEAEPEQFLVKLLRGSGRTLALCYPRCNYDIRRTIALIMSNDDVKRKLINEDLVRAFLDVPNWENARMDDNELESHTSSREMSSLQQALFKTTYGLCGLPEFRERYAEDSKCSPLATECIDALAVISHPRPTTDALNTIPAASACVVLAGLTTTAEYALFLVQQKNVHLSLRPILRQHEDSATLFPALALLDRLAIAPENKTTIFRAGIIYDLPRFLIGFNVQPGIQREAVSVMRRIVLGHLEHVSGIGVCVPTGVAEDADGQYLGRSEEESGLLAALNLFRRTSDAEVKMEIGRLVVEVCRTLFQSTDGHPEEAGNAVRLAFDETNDMASPIAYIACNGKSPEVQGEGWFGLAILSTWQHGRPFILKCLANEEVQKQLEAVLQEREQASCQNISLMLTKLQLFPPDLVSASTRKFLDHAATVAGLPSVWPVLAPAV